MATKYPHSDIIEYSIITGHDNCETLKVSFQNQDYAKGFAEHLFKHGLGSTTNGVGTEKKVQADGNKWAIYIRNDQFKDYCQKVKVPVKAQANVQINAPCCHNMRELLGTLPFKSHIHDVMMEKYPKGDIIDYSIIPANNSCEILKVSFQNQGYAKGFAEHFCKHGLKNWDGTEKQIYEGDNTWSILIYDDQFEEYCKKVQINAIYFHKELEELFEEASNMVKNPCYEKLFEYAIENYLGRFCYDPNGVPVKRLHITVAVIENFLQEALKLTKPENYYFDIDACLTKKLYWLMQEDRLLIKSIQREIQRDKTKQDKDLNWFLTRMNDPGKNRDAHSINAGNRNKKYHPLLDSWYEHTFTNPRGADKKGKIHAKPTATSSSPRKIGAMKRFYGSSGSIVLLFDRCATDVHYKYVFEKNAATNSQWWYAGKKSTQTGVSLAQLIEKNKKIEDDWIKNNTTGDWDELKAGFPEKGLCGIGASDDTRADRLNALSATYKAKTTFGLDYDLPVLIVPVGLDEKTYDYEQRLCDVLDALDYSSAGKPDYDIVLEDNYELLKQVITSVSFRIRDEALVKRASKRCEALNFNDLAKMLDLPLLKLKKALFSKPVNMMTIIAELNTMLIKWNPAYVDTRKKAIEETINFLMGKMDKTPVFLFDLFQKTLMVTFSNDVYRRWLELLFSSRALKNRVQELSKQELDFIQKNKALQKELLSFAAKEQNERKSRLEVIKVLLGPKILHLVCEFNKPELISNLIALKADPTSLNEDRLSPIVVAARLNHWDCVRAFTSTEQDQFADNEQDDHALILAAKANQTDIVARLSKRSAIGTCNYPETGYYAIHFAILHNNIEMLERLIDKGADINSQRDDKHTTPLICAAQDPNVTLDTFVWLLCQEGINVNAKCNGRSALFEVAEQGNIEKIHALLDMPGIDVEAKRNPGDGVTAMDIAKTNNHHNVVQLFETPDVKFLLVQNKLDQDKCKHAAGILAEIYHTHGKEQLQPCLAMIEQEYPSQYPELCRIVLTEIISDAINYNENEFIVNLLKFSPEQLDTRFNQGNTALHLACHSNTLDLVSELMALKADPTLLNEDNLPPMVVAAKLKHWDCVRVFTSTEQDQFSDKEQDGLALIYAAEANQTDIVASLLKRNAVCTRLCPKTGYSAIFFAVIHNNIEMLELLVDKGVYINSQFDNNHPSPLIRAAQDPNVTLETFTWLLRQDGINVNAKCNGKSALFEAAEQGDIEKTHALLNMPSIDVEAKQNPGDGVTAIDIAKINEHNNVVQLFETPNVKFILVKNKLDQDECELATSILAEIYHTHGKEHLQPCLAIIKKEYPSQYPKLCRILLTEIISDAINYNENEFIVTLLKSSPEQFYTRFNQTNTALHLSCHSNKPDLVSELIVMGAVPTLLNEDYLYPIVVAAKLKHWDCVRALTYTEQDQFADKEQDGQALLLTAEANQTDIVTSLLERDATCTWNHPGTGYYAIHFAVLHNNIEMLERLIDKGADINSQLDDNHPTPLICATQDLNVTLDTFVWLLRQEGINVNTKCNGRSALFEAAEQGDLEKVKSLLDMPGIDVEAKRLPEDGVTAIGIAKKNNHNSVVQLFETPDVKFILVKNKLDQNEYEAAAKVFAEIFDDKNLRIYLAQLGEDYSGTYENFQEELLHVVLSKAMSTNDSSLALTLLAGLPDQQQSAGLKMALSYMAQNNDTDLAMKLIKDVREQNDEGNNFDFKFFDVLNKQFNMLRQSSASERNKTYKWRGELRKQLFDDFKTDLKKEQSPNNRLEMLNCAEKQSFFCKPRSFGIFADLHTPKTLQEIHKMQKETEKKIAKMEKESELNDGWHLISVR